MTLFKRHFVKATQHINLCKSYFLRLMTGSMLWPLGKPGWKQADKISFSWFREFAPSIAKNTFFSHGGGGGGSCTDALVRKCKSTIKVLSRQLVCLFNSLLGRASKVIKGSIRCSIDPFEGYIQRLDSPHKGPIMRKVSPCHGVSTSYRWHESVTPIRTADAISVGISPNFPNKLNPQ